jgi:type II secretory pathway pseudopilin PulG
MRNLRSKNTKTGGFTIVEVLMSITVFLLGVISAGSVMVSVQQTAAMSENRYRDNADLRVKIEAIKTDLSTTPVNALKSLKSFKLTSGHDVTGNYELLPAGLPNLVRVELLVAQEKGGAPVQFVTYLRADDI